MIQAIRINKYLPIALLYFFFNGFLLPAGLLYTTILTPLFLVWLSGFPIFKKIWLFFIVAIPFVLVHLYNGVNTTYYLRSFLLLFSVYVFALAFYQVLTLCQTMRLIYKRILLLNVAFIIIALIALYIPSLKGRFWYSNEITSGVETVRLKMLTYEPSYYSILFVPIALYYYLKLVILKLPNPFITFVLLTAPLLLSLSFGVILGLVLALLFTFLLGSRRFFPNKNVPIYIALAGIVFLLLLILATQLFPNNVFVVRIANALSGRDTSFKGRTFDSFYLGWEIAAKKSLLFGCGFGQTKELGIDLFNNLYSTTSYTVQTVGIPNSLGDTLSTLGIVGLILRLYLEIYFFFKTKVNTNYYRLALFLFIFIYQFTGSFITNIAEYAIWVMAFHQNIFSEFDKASFRNYFPSGKGLKAHTGNSIEPA